MCFNFYLSVVLCSIIKDMIVKIDMFSSLLFIEVYNYSYFSFFLGNFCYHTYTTFIQLLKDFYTLYLKLFI